MIVGMDFGTTNSGMAVYDGADLRLIPLDLNNRNSAIARTAMYVTNDRQVYIGREAIDTYYQQNLNRPVKIEKVVVGEITLDFADLPSFKKLVYVEKDVLAPGRLFLSFKSGLPSLNYIGTVIGAQFFFLEDIIALYLYIAKQRAEQFLGTEARKIVLGRPVRYSINEQENQIARERMLRAAFRAGFEEVCFQYEPTAAAYHYETTITQEQNVLIFDFGGGTLDISIMRLGNPKNRAVLATGGVPIAGDIFDQKLVRAKLPKHFGEGTVFRSHGKDLPVPSTFFEAFSSWQDILSLQRPDTFESIQRIERTAHSPLKIRALRNLVSSSYGLKMYDTMEATKRELSDAERVLIKIDGSGFQVREPVTRNEFERIIRSDIHTIETHLDAVLTAAGLTYDDIDAVIRTGGSSQIPAFIHLLESRFGADKVRSIDIFSSVTSGLGILAHHIEHGQAEGQFFRPEDLDYTPKSAREDIPAVDFDTMKKYIALQNAPIETHSDVGLVGVTEQGDVVAAVQPQTMFNVSVKLDQIGLTCEPFDLFVNAAPDQRLLLMTSDYRFLLKTPRYLADMVQMGLRLAETEGFRKDEFGDEHISGMVEWEPLRQASRLMLISHTGYFKLFKADMLVPRIEQPVAYHLNRLKGGYPVALLGVDDTSEVVVFSTAGRALRVSMRDWPHDEGRLMRTDDDDPVLAAFAVQPDSGFITTTSDGKAKIITLDALAPTHNLGNLGIKVLSELRSVTQFHAEQPLYAVTNTRITPIDPQKLDGALSKPRAMLKLHSDEELIGLINQ